MAKSPARRNSNRRSPFHPWAKRWRGPAHRKCGICNPEGRERKGSRKANRDAAVADSLET